MQYSGRIGPEGTDFLINEKGELWVGKFLSLDFEGSLYSGRRVTLRIIQDLGQTEFEPHHRVYPPEEEKYGNAA